VLVGDSGTGTTHLLIGLSAHILETQMSNGEIDLAAFTRFRALSWRTKTVSYWTATSLVVAELVLGGIGNVLRIPSLRESVTHLGYPTYFLVILGIRRCSARLHYLHRGSSSKGVGLRWRVLRLLGGNRVARDHGRGHARGVGPNRPDRPDRRIMGIASGGTQAGPLVVTAVTAGPGSSSRLGPRLRSVAYRILVADTDASAGTWPPQTPASLLSSPTTGYQSSASMSSSAAWRSRLGSVSSPSSKNR
jgi:hypothetical protein